MGTKTCRMGAAQIWQCPPLRKANISYFGLCKIDVNERTFAAGACFSGELIQQHRIHSDIPSGIVRPRPLLPDSPVSAIPPHLPPYSMCFYPTHCSNCHYYVSCHVSSCISSVNKVYFNCAVEILLKIGMLIESTRTIEEVLDQNQSLDFKHNKYD